MLEAYFSHPFRLFFAPFYHCFLLIARYYAVNNDKNPSKNNSKMIHEKIPNSYLETV
jgi:hypothetical protein